MVTVRLLAALLTVIWLLLSLAALSLIRLLATVALSEAVGRRLLRRVGRRNSKLLALRFDRVRCRRSNIIGNYPVLH